MTRRPMGLFARLVGGCRCLGATVWTMSASMGTFPGYLVVCVKQNVHYPLWRRRSLSVAGLEACHRRQKTMACPAGQQSRKKTCGARSLARHAGRQAGGFCRRDRRHGRSGGLLHVRQIVAGREASELL